MISTYEKNKRAIPTAGGSQDSTFHEAGSARHMIAPTCGKLFVRKWRQSDADRVINTKPCLLNQVIAQITLTIYRDALT